MTLTVAEIPLKLVEANPDQPRKHFAGIEELAASIAENGLLQPITVRPMADGKFQIVAGERRFRAISTLAWKTVPCIVRDLEDATAYVLSVMENVARRDMNVVEEAAAIQQVLDTGMSPADAERKLGLPLQNGGYATWKVSLLRCIEPALHLLRTNALSQTMAGQLSKLTPDGQMRALREFQANGLSQTAFTGLVETIWAAENQVEMFPETKLPPETMQAAVRFRKALETLARETKALQGLDMAKIGAAFIHDQGNIDALLTETAGTLTNIKKGLHRARGRQVGLGAA